MLTAFTNQLALVAAVYGVISSLSPTLQIIRMRRAGSIGRRSHRRRLEQIDRIPGEILRLCCERFADL